GAGYVGGELLVASAADEAYVVPLAAAFRSLLDSSGAGSAPRLAVIDGGILPSSRDRLLASWREATDVQFLDLGSGQFEELPIHYAYASRATYLRLLLPDMLPASAARVIYLDPDVLVRADLAQLWQIDLGSYALAAAR